MARADLDRGDVERARAHFLACIASGTAATFSDAAEIAVLHEFDFTELTLLNDYTGSHDRRALLCRHLGLMPGHLFASRATLGRFAAFVRAHHPSLADALFRVNEFADPIA
jgi:hypothetical protein